MILIWTLLHSWFSTEVIIFHALFIFKYFIAIRALILNIDFFKKIWLTINILNAGFS